MLRIKKNDKRTPNAKELTQLMQECTAKKSPVTAADIAMTRLFPGGPILPESCISATRLVNPTQDLSAPEMQSRSDWPDALPSWPDKSAEGEWGDYGFDDEGNLACERWHGEHYWLLHGDTVTHISHSACWGVHLVGFRGQDPVTYGRLSYLVDDFHTGWGTDVTTPVEIHVGGKLFYEGKGCTKPSILPDGSIIWQKRLEQEGHYAVVRNGEVIVPDTTRQYHRFFQLSNSIVGTVLDHKKERVRLRYIEGEHTAQCERCGQIKDVEGTAIDVVRQDGTSYVVLPGNYFGDLLEYDPDSRILKRALDLNFEHTGTYRSDFTRFGEVNYAFVAETPRHLGMKRWVFTVNKTAIPGPNFHAVSRLFEQDGAWRYWGVAGRHLCLMEAPSFE